MTKLKLLIISSYYQQFIGGAFRPKPRLTFCLNTKSKQKSQDCARFVRKTCARKAKILQTPPSGRQTGVFLTPFSLVFRLTGRGQSKCEKQKHKLTPQIQYIT